VHCESLIVEIVDEHGAVLPEGSYGRVVVTDLFNSRMPFIRYDTGDHGTLSWQRCVCGQGAPRLWLEGRYSAFLMLNGRRIHHLEFDVALEIFMNSIIQFQVVKEARDKIVINIIPSTSFDEVLREKVMIRMHSLVGPNVHVAIKLVDAIPKTPRGKSQLVADMTR
jgi:phenylacetate-CoA ligase